MKFKISNHIYTILFLPKLYRCPICNMKPYVCGSTPAYTVIGTEHCPHCGKFAITVPSIFDAYVKWNDYVSFDNVEK